MTTSVFLTNLLWVLLLVNWIAEWDWREKFAAVRQNRLLQAFLVLAAVHLLWFLGAQDIPYALHDLQKKLPLLVIPLVVLTSRPLTRKELINLGICYTGTILVVTIVGLFRYLTLDGLPYRDIVPNISHIRFGLNVCLSIVILAYAAWTHRRHRWLPVVNTLWVIWLLLFLVMIHAYTALFILPVLAVVLLFAYWRKMSQRLRLASATTLIVIIGALAATFAIYHHQYYHLQPLSTQPLRTATLNGNAYSHANDGCIENGNYIMNYICETELRQEWARRSPQPIDAPTATGYSAYGALVRYLNALGVTKDSVGMTRLTSADIAAIEQGIANPVYLRHSPRKLFYALFYENECRRCYHSVNDFSMLQRFELWQGAWQLFLQHPLFGVGTGSVLPCCQQQLVESHSPLAGRDMNTHNQYLNFLVAFGLVGFLLVVAAFVRALHPILHRDGPHLIFLALLVILLISFLTEDTLDTLAGITFAALGLCLPKLLVNGREPRVGRQPIINYKL